MQMRGPFEAWRSAPASSPSHPSAAASMPAPDTPHSVDPQLEALRLAAEASAAVMRLFLHCASYAAYTNPFQLGLRGQIVTAQWMASMLGAQVAPAPPHRD